MNKPVAFGLSANKWLLLLIILLGTALRALNLGGQSIWYDEAVSLAIADRLDLWQILTNQGQSSHPPFYYLLLRFWIQWIGVINDFTARIPSLLSGVLTIPLIYRLGHRLFDRQTGLWSAFLLAGLPFHIYYAQEARMYTLLALITAASLFLFLRAVEYNRWSIWIAFWLCLLLGFYTHYFIVFVIFVYHLYLLINWKQYSYLWRPVGIVDGLLLITFLPQLVIFFEQSKEVFQSYWLGKPSPLALFTTLYFFIVSYTVPLQFYFIGLFAALGLLAIGAYQLFRQTIDGNDGRKKFYLLNLGTFLPLLIALAISQVKPVFLERTLIICTPFLILLLARTLSLSNWRSPVPYLAGILSVVILISLYRYYFDPTAHKPPMGQAAAEISAAFAPDDVVLHTSVGSFMPFLFYQPTTDQYLLWGDPDPRKTATIFELFGGKVITIDSLDHPSRLWLVVTLDHSVEYQRTRLDWFDKHFLLLSDLEVRGIVIRLYDFSEEVD